MRKQTDAMKQNEICSIRGRPHLHTAVFMDNSTYGVIFRHNWA